MQLVYSPKSRAKPLLWKISALTALLFTGSAFAGPLYPSARNSEFSGRALLDSIDQSILERDAAESWGPARVPSGHPSIRRFGIHRGLSGATEIPSNQADDPNSSQGGSDSDNNWNGPTGAWGSGNPTADGWSAAEGSWFDPPSGQSGYNQPHLPASMGGDDDRGTGRWARDGDHFWLYPTDPVPEPASVAFLLAAVFAVALFYTR